MKEEIGNVLFLIDQQASQYHRVTVGDVNATFQPITVTEDTPILESTKPLMKLSRDQALALSKLLTKAALACPAVKGDREYPGMVVKD